MNGDRSQMKEFVANQIYINEMPQRFLGMQMGGMLPQLGG
jgi:hypothetical protein